MMSVLQGGGGGGGGEEEGEGREKERREGERRGRRGREGGREFIQIYTSCDHTSGRDLKLYCYELRHIMCLPPPPPRATVHGAR